MSDSSSRPPHVLPQSGAPQVRRMLVDLCRKSLEEYRSVGYPFGKTMDGLLIWMEHGQWTTDN